jgi:hypothetical protein
VTVNGLNSTPIILYTYGRVEVTLQYLRKPFDNPAKREELRERLNKIDGVNLPSGRPRPSIAIGTFSNEEVLKRFLDVMDWCVGELHSV